MATKAAASNSMDVSYFEKEDERLKPILSWTKQDVAEWIGKMGFPYYQVMSFYGNYFPVKIFNSELMSVALLSQTTKILKTYSALSKI